MSAKVILERDAAAFRQSRGNLLAGFTVAAAVGWRNAFRSGYLRPWASYWRELEESADFTLAAIVPKRRAGVAARDWTVLTTEDTPAAHLQKEALLHFYSNICVRDAIELDQEGGTSQLVQDVADAIFQKYAVHEIIWKADGADLTAELTRCPLEFLANRNGYMTYAGPNGAALNGPRLQPGEWLVSTSRQCLSFPLANAAIFKSFSLQDWLNYNRAYAEPHVWGTTAASYDSSEWTDAENAIAAIGTGARTLLSQGGTLDTLNLSPDGAAVFQPLYDLCTKAQVILVMGSDLSTLSAKDATGASLQNSDKEILVLSDLAHINDNLNRKLDLHVLRLVFGPQVQPLAKFAILPPVAKDVKGIMEKQTHLRDLGVPVSIKQVADELDHSLPSDGEDLIDAPPAAKAPAATVDPLANAEPATALEPAAPEPFTLAHDAMKEDIAAVVESLRRALSAKDEALLPMLAAIDQPALAAATLRSGSLASELLGVLGETLFTALNVPQVLNETITAEQQRASNP